jgi:membrane-associated phospholipid phosphatase
MHAFLHNIHWAVALRTDWLTPVFKAFSSLGYSSFIILFISLGFWAVDKRIFARTGLVVLLSALLNAYLKLVFQDPRPDEMFWLDPRIGDSYGFPSGHAQIAVVLWMWLAWEVRKKWVWVVCGVVAAGICFSRLYLGVHDIEDVMGGAVIGTLTLLLFGLFVSPRFKRFVALNTGGQILALAVLTVVMFLIWPEPDAGIVMLYGGFLIGLWTGVGIDRRTIGYTTPSTLRLKAAAGVLGLICFLMLNTGLQAALAAVAHDQFIFVFAQGLILGLYATFFAPWVFIKLKLATASDRIS